MVWFLLPLAYLTGCFPTAYVMGKRLKGIDIRKTGDLNMGARNAYFVIGHRAGILIGIIDGLKGLVVIMLARWFGAPQSMMLWSGVMAVLGHNFPVFLGFRGGRGEATTIGVLTGVMPLQMVIMGSIAIATLILLKNVILTSAVLFIGLMIVCWVMDVPGLLIFYEIGLAILVALTHFFRVFRPRRRHAGAGSA
jgi:glycerol-3-phosphate acyltransferase PlsY